MRWLEIIEIRSIKNNWKILEPELKGMIKELNQNAEQCTIAVYRSISLEGDYRIHLTHDSETADFNGSDLGLHIVSTLREIGLINHSVWAIYIE